MGKQLTINNEVFEVIKPRKREVVPVYPGKWDYTNIYKAYERPSIYKVQVWQYWCEFSAGTDGEPFIVGMPFISSRNTFAFTVTANVYQHDVVNNTCTFAGVMVVTRDHNRIYLKH